jgi:hypothetical protein
MKKSSDLRSADHRGAPHLQHEFFAADRLTLTGGQGGQDLILGPGERLRGSRQGDFAAFAVDGDRSGNHRTRRRSSIARDAADASHDGVNARQQHRFTDGFDQVVIGACAQA